MNDMIEIQCPNCGGTVRRQPGEYFAVCPYCNSEVGFDELKEEAAVTGMRSRLEALDRRFKNEQAFKHMNAKRKKAMWIFLLIMTGMYMLGMIFAGIGEEDSALVGIGAVLIISGLFGILPCTIVYAGSYTVFNDVKGAEESNGAAKFREWLRLVGISLLLLALATIAAVIICFMLDPQK